MSGGFAGAALPKPPGLQAASQTSTELRDVALARARQRQRCSALHHMHCRRCPMLSGLMPPAAPLAATSATYQPSCQPLCQPFCVVTRKTLQLLTLALCPIPRPALSFRGATRAEGHPMPHPALIVLPALCPTQFHCLQLAGSSHFLLVLCTKNVASARQEEQATGGWHV